MTLAMTTAAYSNVATWRYFADHINIVLTIWWKKESNEIQNENLFSKKNNEQIII